MADENKDLIPKEEQIPEEKFQTWVEKYRAPVMVSNARWDRWRTEPESGLLIGLSKHYGNVRREYYAPNRYGTYYWYAAATFELGEDKKFYLRAINKWSEDLSEQTTISFSKKNMHPRIYLEFTGIDSRVQYDKNGNFLYIEGEGDLAPGLQDPDDPYPHHWQIQKYDLQSGMLGVTIVEFPEDKLFDVEKVGENLEVRVTGVVEGEHKVLERALVPLHIDEGKILDSLKIPEELLEDPYNSHSGEDWEWKNANLRQVWGVKNLPINDTTSDK